MTNPNEAPIDNTRSQEGFSQPSTADTGGGVLGGDANARMDGGNESIGRGADGDTTAREQLRVDLGERSEDTDRETGDPGLGSDEPDRAEF